MESLIPVLNSPLEQWKYLGQLFLECGNIVVCDPMNDYRSRNTVQRSVPAGTYPVYALEVEHPSLGSRFAYAQVVISEDVTKKCIHARFALQNSFFVDSGLACFMDIYTCNKYIAFVKNFYKENEGKNLYTDLFDPLFEANVSEKSGRGDWVNFTLPGTQNNIVMFASGLGDGSYKAFWGMGKGNRPARLMIDFNIGD